MFGVTKEVIMASVLTTIFVVGAMVAKEKFLDNK